MRKHNFTTTTRGNQTTNSRHGIYGKHGESTHSSKLGESRKYIRTTESRLYNGVETTTRKPSALTTTIKSEPVSTEKQDLGGTAKRRTRNSTIRGSNYQEKEYIVAIIENYAREVTFSVNNDLGWNISLQCPHYGDLYYSVY
jgi:hypothetical protein